ncbi:hypothetical protein [Bacillus solitudinis]|uniref:hypothetical protein n=1 Tax=Bacillus solitudinis TaxID=2014074 RepID=UPI000C232E28|nr:hypothetical protein [Bacillus solitudinis]
MRVLTSLLFISISLLVMLPNEAEATEKTWFYIDGQEQRYQGNIEVVNQEVWVPARPILHLLPEIHKEWGIDSAYLNRWLRDELEEEEEEIEELLELERMEINNREYLSISDIKELGLEAYYYQDEKILHINTPGLMEINEITIGLSKTEINHHLENIHWNTGFGKVADFIGFYGEMNPYSYKDRYGYVREEEVPDLQIEVIDDIVTYLIISSDEYVTSKNIKVGDSLSDVFRAYGNQFVREQEDGKQIVVYDVEFGSIWFIAGENQKIERFAFWNNHLEGFGEKREKIEEKPEQMTSASQ